LIYPRRSIVGLFGRPQSAERALRALLAGDADLFAISVVARDRRPGPIAAGAPGDREANTEDLLALAVDGDLGRRVGAGVLAVGLPRAIVIAGALARRLRGAARGSSNPLAGALVASDVPRPAIARYLAAVEVGGVLLMVGATTTQRESRVKETLARHGAFDVRSYPVAPPGQPPATVPGGPVPWRAVPAEQAHIEGGG
jgi:hypothetical protein